VWPAARGASAAAPATKAIDFHHHFNPPFLVNAAAGNRVGTGGVGLNWDLAYSLDDMDKSGIRCAIISPPTGFAERIAPDKRVGTIKTVNEYGAELVRDHKGRFLQLIYVPLPDVDASLKEIAHGFDDLKVVGAGFATSYGDKYVAIPPFTVFEGNRRKALAYFHPLRPPAARAFSPHTLRSKPSGNSLRPARAVMGLFCRAPSSSTAIKWVFSHSGGAVPMFAGRFKRLTPGERLSKVAQWSGCRIPAPLLRNRRASSPRRWRHCWFAPPQ
jgi:predicted TIM-barrel fold metal-dependent hydrolase